MPNFESNLTNKKFNAPQMREIDVPDETGYQPPQQPQQPMGGGNFAPSVSRRFGTPMNEQEIHEFQQRMEQQANPDNNLSQIEQEMRQAREDRKRGQPLNDGARKRIEMLIGMTRATRAVEIEGNQYQLQTLKGKEMRQAILDASQFDGTVQSPFEIRKQFLARSLVLVAGVPIDQFVGTSNFQARLDFIEEMDDQLLNRLMDEYSLLAKESKDRYAIKKQEEVEGLVEDLKK